MKRIIDSIRDLYAREPARLNALLSAIVIGAAAALGIVLDAEIVAGIVSVVVLLLAGEKTRRVVVPAAKSPARPPEV